jgi:hypothetical protein
MLSVDPHLGAASTARDLHNPSFASAGTWARQRASRSWNERPVRSHTISTSAPPCDERTYTPTAPFGRSVRCSLVTPSRSVAEGDIMASPRVRATLSFRVNVRTNAFTSANPSPPHRLTITRARDLEKYLPRRKSLHKVFVPIVTYISLLNMRGLFSLTARRRSLTFSLVPALSEAPPNPTAALPESIPSSAPVTSPVSRPIAHPNSGNRRGVALFQCFRSPEPGEYTDAALVGRHEGKA